MGVLPVFNWQGVAVAPGDTIFTTLPSWTRLDNQQTLRVAEIQIRRGRSDEFERTDTGTMTVGFNDRAGDVDPTRVDWISRPFAFAVRNPVTGIWHPRFRGAIDDHGYNLHPSQIKGDVVIEAADALDYLANFELAPGLAGDVPPAQSAGWVFYEDTAGAGAQIRINQALADGDWPSDLSSIFTGNVNLLETVYSPGESLLTVIHDAADAEFPGVANLFVDRYGVLCFHGRRARFDPVAVAATATHWDFSQWTVGDGGIQPTWPFASSRSRRMVRNAAMCYPQGIAASARASQVVTDLPSIARHGTRSWSAENLIVKNGTSSGLTGAQECKTYANYVVRNYKDSQVRIPQLSFKPLRPEDARAAGLWSLLCEVDISDQVIISKSHPGGGGFVSKTYFVEGITEVWRPWVLDLNTGYPFCEMTLDLSPAAYWTTEPELP